MNNNGKAGFYVLKVGSVKVGALASEDELPAMYDVRRLDYVAKIIALKKMLRKE